MTLVSDKARCRSKEGKSYSGCQTLGSKSLDGCQAACLTLEVCLGITYNKASQFCLLITTAEPTNGCPKGFTWYDKGIFAKSVDDLYPNGSNPNLVCYAKIQVDKKERR